MSDFDRRLHNQGQQGATPADSTSRASWRSVRYLSLLRAMWTPKKRSRRDFFAGLNGGLFSAPFRGKNWAVAVFLVLLALPITAAIIGYVTKPTPGTERTGADSPARSSSNSLVGGTKAKPAPGKPMLPVTQAPPASPAPQTPAPAAPGYPPTAAAPQSQATPSVSDSPPAPVASAPPAPVVVTKAPYAPAMYPARHDKHFGESCSGQLTLNSSGLVFNCPGDPRGSVQVGIDQIDSVDDNGVRLISGKKYHFSIPGMTKNGEEELFADWLSRIR